MHDGSVARVAIAIRSATVWCTSESPEEQVLSLLLTSSFLKDVRIRASLPTLTCCRQLPAVSYEDYLRLRYLAKEIPAWRIS